MIQTMIMSMRWKEGSKERWEREKKITNQMCQTVNDRKIKIGKTQKSSKE